MKLGDRNRPVVVRSEVTVPQLGDRRAPGEVRLPTSSREANLAGTYARLGKRRWPLVLGYPWRHEETVSYRLPKDTRVVHWPSRREMKSRFGELSLVAERSPAGVTIRSIFVVAVSRISPEEYPAFRAFLRDADTALEERLVVALGRSP